VSTQIAPDISRDEAQTLVDAVPHWHHAFEITPGVRSKGTYDPESMMLQMELPRRLDGLTALDIGCNDGYFTFELERRGAEVTSVDYSPPTAGYTLAHQLRGSRVEHFQDNVYNMTASRYGQYDIVFLLGVIYHLRHPLLAIDICSTLVKPGGTLVLETHATDHSVIKNGGFYELGDPDLQMMQFLPYRELANDESNWWTQSLSCLASMTASALFEIKTAVLWNPTRALVVAEKAEQRESEFYGSAGFHADTAVYFPPGALDAPSVDVPGDRSPERHGMRRA
jgi:tRNA (mo5U34)-methyltransferase